MSMILKNACRPGRTTSSTVIRRPLIEKVQVQIQGSPRGICFGQSGTATGSSLCTLVSSSQHVIDTTYYYYYYYYLFSIEHNELQFVCGWK